ncbi:MAG: septation protein IspZ [Pseudomonadota bacterium]
MLKQLSELFPLIIMVIAYLITKDDWMTTLALTLATAGQWLLLLLFKQPIPKFQRMVFLSVLVFGSLTLLLDDERFIKWKMSFIYGIFSILLIYGHWAHKNYLQRMFESISNERGDVAIKMERPHWQQLNLIFIAYFIALGLANAYVALYMTFEDWVSFKVIVFFISLIVFPLTLVAFVIRNQAPVEKEIPTDSSNSSTLLDLEKLEDR